VYVADVHHGLVGEQVKIAKKVVFLFRMGGMVACEPTGGEMSAKRRVERQFVLRFFFAGFQALFGFSYPVVKCVEIFEYKLGFDNFDVALGIDGAINMDDVGVIETSDDMENGINVAYVCEELIAEAFPFVGAANQAGNVKKLQRGGSGFRGPEDLRQSIKPIVGDGNNANIGIDRAKGIVCHFSPGGCDGVEEGRFSDIGESDNTAGKAHASLISILTDYADFPKLAWLDL